MRMTWWKAWQEVPEHGREHRGGIHGTPRASGKSLPLLRFSSCAIFALSTDLPINGFAMPDQSLALHVTPPAAEADGTPAMTQPAEGVGQSGILALVPHRPPPQGGITHRLPLHPRDVTSVPMESLQVGPRERSNTTSPT
jgi:hypothetical protein